MWVTFFEKLRNKAPGPVPDRIDQIICDHTYNKKVPSQDGEIVLKVLEPQLHDQLKSPYSDEVRNKRFNGHYTIATIEVTWTLEKNSFFRLSLIN